MKEMFDKIIAFLAQYDFMTVTRAVRDLSAEQILKNPAFWIVTVPFVGYCVLRRRYKYIIVAVSVVAFAYLVGDILPRGGESIEPTKLVKFVGGTVGLLAVNFYLLFVRDI
jgi:ascorbate-specific PTS system EIIC-type component UlaA